MADTEVVQALLQMGQAAVFLFLFLRADSRLQKQEEDHRKELRELNEERAADQKRWIDTLTAIITARGLNPITGIQNYSPQTPPPTPGHGL